MAAPNVQLYRDTLELIRLYNTNLSFKTSFRRLLDQKRVTYKGRPLKIYVRVLSSLNKQYKEYLEKPLNSESVNDLFKKFYLNRYDNQKLEQSIALKESVLPINEEVEINKIDALPDSPQKTEAFNKWLEKHIGEKEEKIIGGGGGKPLVIKEEEDKKEQSGQIQVSQKDVERLAQEEWVRQPQPPRTVSEPVTTTPEPSRQPTFRPPSIPEGVKTAASEAQMGARNLGQQAANTVGNMAKDAASGLLRSGGGLAARVGNAAVQAGIRGVAAIAAGGLGAAGATVGGAIALAVVIVIAVLVLVPMFQQQVKDESLLMTGVAQAAPIGPGGDISQCKFTRAGVSKPITSSKLRAIFQEVAAKSGVPASVLASLAMHENSTFTADANDNHDAFFNRGFTGPECQPHFATSPTGALGLMQVQPPLSILPRARPDAHSASGVRRGAELAGKTYESLTMADFCDVRTSVYLGAGVLLMKNGGRPPTTGDEIKNSVCSYYGQCQYGPYNYGEEAKADFENCKPTTVTPGPLGIAATCPLSQNGNGNFSITCGSFNDTTHSCRHGNSPAYYSVCQAPPYAACPYTPQLQAAIDVIVSGTNGGNNTIYLPFINGEDKLWGRVGSPVALKGGTWGYKMIYRTEHQGKVILLDLSHLSYSDVISGRSGSRVGVTQPGVDGGQSGHLHTALSINGTWVEPKDAKMCY